MCRYYDFPVLTSITVNRSKLVLVLTPQYRFTVLIHIRYKRFIYIYIKIYQVQVQHNDKRNL